MDKEYEFEVNLCVGIAVSGKDEAEARSKLTEAVAEYFAETVIEVDQDEAELLEVREI